jgi:hypothetical protein
MKDNLIMNHYKSLIENYLFDEYDILGFLIFVRELLDKSNCQFIREFCDLIAHRKRDQGIIRENIVNSINNSYAVNSKKKVKGYKGIAWETWLNEWKSLGEKINIDFLKDDKKVLKEITICIISLAQDTKYYDKDVIIGKVEPFIDCDKYLSLITTEGKSDSLMVCLMKCGPFKDLIDDSNGFIDFPLETRRENKKLCLYYNETKILEI